MRKKRTEQYSDHKAKLYPELHKKIEGKRVMSRTVTFQVTDACNLACTYCLDGDTPILMRDYTHKSIKDIQVGDLVIGFDETVERYKQTKVREAEVLNIFHHKSKVLKLETTNNKILYITANHKVLTHRNKTFVEAGKLTTKHKIYFNPLIDLLEDNTTINNQFKIGYLIGVIKGDGSLKHYIRKNDYADIYKFRLAVKDEEIIRRAKQFLDDLGFNTYLKPFLISEKYNITKDAIFSNRKDTFFGLSELIKNNFRNNNNYDYYRGFLSGIYDAEGHLARERYIRICNTDIEIISEIEDGLRTLKIPYKIENLKGTKNKEHKYNVRIETSGENNDSFRFIKLINSSLFRKTYEYFINYSPFELVEIKSIEETNKEIDVYNIETTTGTYIANGIAVHNCYQINKGHRSMSLETAKKFVDYLLSADESNSYINPEISPFIIIEFIGGDPLLEIELIDNIMDYFIEQCFQKEHPWATRYVISLCTNGVLYFDPKVQRFFNKHKNHISLNVTIDGNKELHDSCRIFPDGRPSYDLAVAAAKDWMDNKKGYMGSKITIAPQNVQYVFEALKHMIALGYEEVNANCVFEDGWELPHATELYHQMKMFSDYLIDNNLDNIYCSFLEEHFFKPKKIGDDDNWCGGTGSMLACDPDGYLYPCLRYMESSVGNNQPPLRIGHVDTGIETNEKEKQVVKCLECITRRTQSTDKCYYCPIADGCAWCSAYNYQVFGTADKRATYICIMHQARALANIYYWNKLYQKNNEDKQMLCYVPKEWAIPIIGEDEYNMLIELSGGAPGINPYQEEFEKGCIEEENKVKA